MDDKNIAINGYIGILSGVSSDLSDLDFSHWGLQCFGIEDNELKQYVEKYSSPECFDKNLDRIYNTSKKESFRNMEFYSSENQCVFVPIDLSNPAREEDIWSCEEVLLVMFPSAVGIRLIYHIDIYEGKDFTCGPWTSYEVSPLHYEESSHLSINRGIDPTELNAFLSLYYERGSKMKYFQVALKFYSSAFHNRNLLMSFVQLCSTLETIVSARHEVTYRLRRNLAVLCGTSRSESDAIYNNMGKIYSLRSEIVHSALSNKSEKILANEEGQFDRYLSYIRIMASRMLIEIILQNFNSLDELNRKLNELGFGEKSVLSENYEDHIFCYKGFYDILTNPEYLNGTSS